MENDKEHDNREKLRFWLPLFKYVNTNHYYRVHEGGGSVPLLEKALTDSLTSRAAKCYLMNVMSDRHCVSLPNSA